MASLRVLAFDHEGRPIQFNTWLDDLHLYLLSDSRDSVSIFDLASGTSHAPPATVDSATRSQWLTRDAAARLAIRNHMPLAECTHFGQHRTAQTLYDAVVSRYSLPATAALGRLLLPYLFPELSAFATVKDLVSHIRASEARYRAALPAEFLDRNTSPMYITLYFIVTRLPDSLCSVRDHFLSLDPTSFTVDELEQHFLATETSAVALGAARGTPRTPFFEGCSPSPLAPSYSSAPAIDVLSTEDVGAASASVKRCSNKGKGGRGGGGGSGSGGGGSSGGSGGSGGGGSGGNGGGSGGVDGGGGGSGGSGGSGSGGSGGSRIGAQRGGSGGGRRQRLQRRSETPSPQQLREWLFQRGASRGSVSCPFVIHKGDRAGQTCGKAHTQHRCFSRLYNAWRVEFGDEVECPHWAELLRSGVAIFDLDYDAILSAMYALSASAEGDCYRCVPPDPGIDTAALGASESVLPGTTPAEALHTFTLDSGASRYFFRDSTTLTPLPAPVPVRPADPSGGPVVARSSTILLCSAVPSGSPSGHHLPSLSTNLVSTAALQDAMVTTTTPGGQRVSICTCTRTGCHLAMFTCRPESSLYTLATEPHQVAASAHLSASGHPSLPRLRGMHSGLLVSGLPRSLPPLPRSPAPSCLPCVEGQQRTAPHSSSFPPTTAPLQTLHMDVWSPANVDGQGRERYFLLVIDDYTRYTTPRERFRADLPVMRLHCDRGGEFFSDLLHDFCRGEGILHSFTLPDSPQQNGIAKRRIGLVMEVARTSMIHAAAPHFLWPFAVRYAAHQLSLWPNVSFPETSPTLRLTGKVGDASVFRVWGSRPFFHDKSADKLSARAVPCVFLGFTPDAPGWQFYHPTSRRVFLSQDVTFDELVPFYRLSPYRSAPLFLAPGSPPVDPLPPQGPAPSGVSQVDPLPCTAPVEVAVGSGAAPGAASGGVGPTGAEPGVSESEGARSGGAEPGGEELEGAEPTGVGPGGAEPEGVESGGAESEGAESGVTGVGVVGAGGAGVTAGVGGTGGIATTSPGGARTKGTGAVTSGGVGGTGFGDILTLRSYAEAITAPYSSQWQAAMDAEMASWKVKRPSGSPLAFKARYLARGFCQRQGVDFFQTFSPTPKMTTLWVLLHATAQRDYELHSLDFSTDFLQGSLHEEIWLRRPHGFTGLFPAGTQWSLRQPVYGLCQAPREWHDTLRTSLAALGFAPSTADPSLILRTDTSLPPFYVLVYVNDLVFAIADTKALTLVKSELQKRHTCTDLGELRSWLADHSGQSTAHHHPDSVTHGAPGPSTLRLLVLLATAHSSVYRPLSLSSTLCALRPSDEAFDGKRAIVSVDGPDLARGCVDEG
ncbi:unnamed protein product [Closterium sp. NIES-54]